MDEKWFWNLIESSKTAINNDLDKQMKVIERQLTKFSGEELYAFDRIFWDLLKQSYSYPLWDAAAIMQGGFYSPDGFDYFRGWLIAQGETTFNQALQDPNSLAEIAEDLGQDYDYECEDLFGLASIARDYYREKTGQEMPNNINISEPEGESISEEELPNRFPRLWTIFFD